MFFLILVGDNIILFQFYVYKLTLCIREVSLTHHLARCPWPQLKNRHGKILKGPRIDKKGPPHFF